MSDRFLIYSRFVTAIGPPFSATAEIIFPSQESHNWASTAPLYVIKGIASHSPAGHPVLAILTPYYRDNLTI